MKTPCYFQIVPAGESAYDILEGNLLLFGGTGSCRRNWGPTPACGSRAGAVEEPVPFPGGKRFQSLPCFGTSIDRDRLRTALYSRMCYDGLAATISQLVLLVCVVLVTSTEGGFYGVGERHVYAGAEDYPPGFVISTLRSEEDKHGHEQRGYGHGHRDYVNEPEYVVRSPYGALLQQAESHSQFYGGGVGPIGHDHVGFYGTGVREDYLMAR
ncbi:unnamed protein product [Ixodes pacificus]